MDRSRFIRIRIDFEIVLTFLCILLDKRLADVENTYLPQDISFRLEKKKVEKCSSGLDNENRFCIIGSFAHGSKRASKRSS